MPISGGGSGGGGGGGGGLTLLNPSTYSLAADGTFDFQSLDQSYNDLYVKMILRGTAAAVTDSVFFRVNNDSTANYLRGNWHSFNGTLGGAAFGAAQTSAYVCDVPAATGTANRWTTAELSIQGYKRTDMHKNIACYFMEYDGTTGEIGGYVNIWTSTAAINRLGAFGAATANLLAGSQFRIYGLL